MSKYQTCMAFPLFLNICSLKSQVLAGIEVKEEEEEEIEEERRKS